MTDGLAEVTPEEVAAPAGGIVAELERMSPEERAAHEVEGAEAVAPDRSAGGGGGAEREIAVEVGDTLLELRDVTLRFGGLVALDSVSFDIRRGEIFGLIG